MEDAPAYPGAEVIALQTVSVDFPFGLLAGFGQCLRKTVSVNLVDENVFTLILTAPHMILDTDG